MFTFFYLFVLFFFCFCCFFVFFFCLFFLLNTKKLYNLRWRTFHKSITSFVSHKLTHKKEKKRKKKREYNSSNPHCVLPFYNILVCYVLYCIVSVGIFHQWTTWPTLCILFLSLFFVSQIHVGFFISLLCCFLVLLFCCFQWFFKVECNINEFGWRLWLLAFNIRYFSFFFYFFFLSFFFYFLFFCFILFCFILFYFVLFYFILFYFILFLFCLWVCLDIWNIK